MKLIVSDTGPLLHLTEANLLGVLQDAGKIYIPKLVEVEMYDLHPQWTKHRPEWIFTKSLFPDEVKEAESLCLAGPLDFGEAGAIVLSKRDSNLTGFSLMM